MLHQLTEKEQEVFRAEYQEKEREIQRYIGVYLSGLVLVTGWILGPQSKPLLLMILGNEGYNVYGVLIIVSLNVIFTSFLIYKSIIVHEITQFITFLAPSKGALNYWESWRRSRQSATKRVRSIYTVILAVLPMAVSGLIMYGLWRVLHTDVNALADQYNHLQISASVPATSAPVPINAAHLSEVLNGSLMWFYIVLALHAIPFWFFYENVVPTGKRWSLIRTLKPPDLKFDDLRQALTKGQESHSGRIVLHEKNSGSRIGHITQSQWALLNETLELQSSGHEFYLSKEDLDSLGQHGMESDLIALFRKAVGQKKGVEIFWKAE